MNLVLLEVFEYGSFAEEFFEHLFNILPSYRHYQIQQGTALHLASVFPEVLQALQGISLKTVKAKKNIRENSCIKIDVFQNFIYGDT